MRAFQRLQTPIGEAITVAVLVMIAYAGLRMSPTLAIGAFHDDAIYLALGKAIASGEGFRSIYAAGEPVHLKYPPGLPLIYAALWTLGGSLAVVATAARFLALMVCGATAGLLWWLARTKLQLQIGHAALWVVGPFVLEGTLQFFNLPIAEPYFMLGWAAALLLCYRVEDESAGRRHLLTAAGLGAVLAATTLIRMQAIVMIPAFLLAMAIQRVRWRAIATAATVAIAPILAWRLIHAGMASRGPVSTQPDELPYAAWLEADSVASLVRFIRRSLAYNWYAYWDGFPGYVSELTGAGIMILAILLALVLWGAWLLVRRHPALVLSLAATVALIMTWPWPQDRFVLAFLPFAGLLVAFVIQTALTRCHRRLRVAAYATLVLLTFSIGGRQLFIRSLAYRDHNPRDILGFNYAGYFLLANSRFLLTVSRWVRERAEPTDRLLVDMPAGVYLYTERRGVAATPAESRIAPSVFERPGHYLATRIRDDSISVVVLGSVVRQESVMDVAAFYQRCPGLIRYVGAEKWWSVALFYRVQRRDDACMTTQLLRE